MIRIPVGLLSTCCPHCTSIDFRSVAARNGVEVAFQWLLQPYRCALCGRHFYLFRWQIPLEGTT
jgi:transposase-like protein